MTGNAVLDLMLIAIPVILAGLWWTGSRAHELAVAHARRACAQKQVQFLDQTVALSRIRLARDGSGQQCLKRTYQFEFTSYGEYRDTATVTLIGHHLRTISFPYLRDADGNRIYTQ